MKRCTRCDTQKELIEFGTRTRTRDGFAFWCRACEKEHRQTKVEAKREYDKKYREENRECISKKVHEKYMTNPVPAKERAKRHREKINNTPELKEKYAEFTRRWKRENPDKVRQGTNRRRAKMKGVFYGFTLKDWEMTKIIFDNGCVYCGKTDKPLEQDHFIPLSRGGGFVMGNIVPACRECNLSKGNRLPEKWVDSKEILDSITFKLRNMQEGSSDIHG